MEGTYDVTLGSQKMGTVSVRKQGLYWLFDCTCSLSGEVMYDLAVRIGDTQAKLGLLTPEKGAFCLTTKLPSKRFGQGRPVFSLQPRHPEMKGMFVAVNPDEPFHYLHRLESSYLAIRAQQIGLIVHDKK